MNTRPVSGKLNVGSFSPTGMQRNDGPMHVVSGRPNIRDSIPLVEVSEEAAQRNVRLLNNLTSAQTLPNMQHNLMTPKHVMTAESNQLLFETVSNHTNAQAALFNRGIFDERNELSAEMTELADNMVMTPE